MSEIVKSNWSGSTWPNRPANNEPAMPAHPAPIAKASNLAAGGFTPTDAAAVSSSRTAAHARPMREAASRPAEKVTSTSSASATK